jgi:molybdopterin-guanine dinucleotide biosynthesis protein A
MTGIILAGGKSKRMGVNKAFLKIRGETIIDNTLSIFKRIFQEIIIVTNTPEEYEYTKATLVEDIAPGKGALGGIYTGLLAAHSQYCFVCACDMPFISENLVRYIAGFDVADIAVPVVRGFYEPMFAMYSKNCINAIKKQLDEGSFKIIDIFPGLNIKEIPESELRRFDEGLHSFININTLEDYQAAFRKAHSPSVNT